MTPLPAWLRGRGGRGPDAATATGTGIPTGTGTGTGTGTDREAPPAAPTTADVVRVAGLSSDLPALDRGLTVVVTTRSDRHAAVPSLIDTVRDAFGTDVDVRVVGYVADASPRDPFDPALPWVRTDHVDGIGSAVNAALSAGVGRVVLLLDSTIEADPGALRAIADGGRDAVTVARVTTADGSLRAGVRLLRPGALPWTDDRGDAGPECFAADQPALSMPRAALGPAPCLPDERTTLTVWTRAAADRTGGPVRVAAAAVRRTAEAGRTVDRDVVDAVAAWRDREPDGDGVVAAAPPLPPWGARPVVPAVRGTVDERAMSWSVKIAAPAGSDGDAWGDVHFAAELAAALERLGQRVRVDRRDAHVRPDDATDDVTLVVRGLDRVPPNPASVNLLWVISHPTEVTDTELRSFDAVFSAGPTWGADAAERAGVPVRTLLQATDPAVFSPAAVARGPVSADTGRVVFVGSTRGTERRVVADAVSLGADLRVHGPGWDGVVPAASIGSPSLTRAEVAAAYASARVVLNDHWPDMAAGGFVSNRVFDVLAAGGVVVTDEVTGLRAALDVPTLAVASDRGTLAALLDPAHPWPDAATRAGVAARIAAEHSFDARAAVLLDAARAEHARLHR